ncbi:hypothetical protein RhiirB3_382357 [Rhizophagus irregularis]|nr:hypothetical protein RhiirB3_382357 [Rhizophagus irregularis]
MAVSTIIEVSKANKNLQNLHNSKPITLIEVSPNEEYLVTYSKEDKSIIGWNFKGINEGKCYSDNDVQISDVNLRQICISDNQILAYIYNDNDDDELKIINLDNKQQNIELEFDEFSCGPFYCTFNTKNEFIFCSDVSGRNDVDHKIIWIYSTQPTKNNKWICKSIYKIPNDFRLISASNYDRLYLFSNDSIYEWNIITEKSTKIFIEDVNEIKKDVKILSDGKFICLRISDRIIIYSIELEIIIASLDKNNDIQLYKFMKHPGLYPLLLPLLLRDNVQDTGANRKSIMKHCWKEYLDHNQIPNECQSKTTAKYAFVILADYIRKIKLENSRLNFSYQNFDGLNNNSDESSDSNKLNNENDKVIEVLDTDECEDAKKIKKKKLFVNPYIYVIYALFQEDLSKPTNPKEIIKNSIKWKIEIVERVIEKEVEIVKLIKLQVFKKSSASVKWDLICESYSHPQSEEIVIRGIKLFNENNIVILTTLGLFIYNFNGKTISLNYSNSLKSNTGKREKYEKDLKYNLKKVFSKPLPNYDDIEISDELFMKDIKESLLKYGVELLSFAIKEHKLELIESIYEECLTHFKEDKNDRMFLSIIIFTMPLLNKYYPEYISRYSLETTMIMDSSYNMEYQNNNLHLCSFQHPQIVNLTRSILWTKYLKLVDKLEDDHMMTYYILSVLTKLLILPILPIYFATFNILLRYHFINDFYTEDALSSFYFNIFDTFKTQTLPTITFMIPYIKFVNYPKNYNWFLELIRPQSSPFIKTISKDIYKTWNGEPKSDYLNHPEFNNNDPNNPWNLINIYNQINQTENGTLIQNASFIQIPNENTNMFTDYRTALFAIYLFLTGDQSALSDKWTYKDNPAFVILIVLFSFLIVIYLMNLFIGLLNIAIEKDNNRVSYLIQKVEILAEIELFYLLPNQRRWNIWFPEIMYYYANIDKIREEIKKLINENQWNTDKFLEIKKQLLNILNIQIKNN